MASVDNMTLSARASLQAAGQRLDSLLKDPKVGAGRELPDETLNLVTCCLDAISDVVERRRALDMNQSNQPTPQEAHRSHPLDVFDVQAATPLVTSPSSYRRVASRGRR